MKTWMGAAALWVLGTAAAAQQSDFGALARLDPEASAITERRGDISAVLALSQGVPFRIFSLDAPPRIVVDFREVDWAGTLGPELVQTDLVTSARVGGFRPGWSRMVLELAGPYALAQAGLTSDPNGAGAELHLLLEETTAEVFAAGAGVPEQPGWDLPEPADTGARPEAKGDGDLVIVLDPGHGGIDPGAGEGETLEKDVMLAFARELKEALLRRGDTQVVMTREDDSFVSLERRVAIAHAAEADLFLSLHADSLGEGRARGATIYKLGKDASDAASAALAERHDRADMLAGLDLSGTDDVVADVLMDLARMETQPRADLLARALLIGLEEGALPVNSKPIRTASFSVLKSPDIPSLLLELGFLSNGRDLNNLTDPEWRGRMAQAIADGIGAWMIADAANADLVRQ
ncbi:N-acetylmuramoyl-L-alanine amidase [Roseovarius nanhaiticus]|uniref:N-acetylmuramoyl-L-alanine amidase n=1 Tax=Roseovarius nanhaiticus TaxID=573024 RepID=UPI0024921FE8|nr:N-acetylmuramoyl-L-alanine amidase [Roseovarius nanhaiticus]